MQDRQEAEVERRRSRWWMSRVSPLVVEMRSEWPSEAAQVRLRKKSARDSPADYVHPRLPPMSAGLSTMPARTVRQHVTLPIREAR